MIQSPTGVPCGSACGAESPCCQLEATSSFVEPGARNRTSKYVVFDRLLPVKVTVTEPPRGTLGKLKAIVLMIGDTSASDFTFAQGAFIDVMQVLLSNVLAPAADRLRMSKPKA